MPTQHVTSEVMKSGLGKHWTKEEIAKREHAEKALKRRKEKGIYPPTWLSSKAKIVWRRVVKSAIESGLILDNLDTESLAIYCDVYSKYQELSKKAKEPGQIKNLLSFAKQITLLADKMGFTPAARARLAKRMVDRPRDLFGEEFD